MANIGYENPRFRSDTKIATNHLRYVSRGLPHVPSSTSSSRSDMNICLITASVRVFRSNTIDWSICDQSVGDKEHNARG